MRIAVLPYGDRALLVELEDTAAVVAYVEALRADEPPGLDDVVPAAETVLVVADSPASVPALRTVLLALSPGDDAAAFNHVVSFRIGNSASRSCVGVTRAPCQAIATPPSRSE